MSTFKPRPYQLEAREEILARFDNDVRRVLFVMPPAGGKTFVAALVARELLARGLRGLVLVDRREHVHQHREHLIRAGLAEDAVGMILSKVVNPAPNALIQVACLSMLYKMKDLPPADFLFTDEAHHDAAEGRRHLRAAYPDAFCLGYTGTPCRLGGKHLDGEFDEMLVGPSIAELIDWGFIQSPRVFTVPPDSRPDLKGVRLKGGDYDVGDLERAVSKRALIGDIVEHWKRHAGGRQTAVFGASIRHAQAIAERFETAGITARAISADTTVKEREALLAEVVAGTVRVICCVSVLAEGWDCPQIRVVVQARPTRSLAMHLQQCARGMRLGDDAPLILDHAGNMLMHGLPQMERDWALPELQRSLPIGTTIGGGATGGSAIGGAAGSSGGVIGGGSVGGAGGRPAGPPAKACPVCSAVVKPDAEACPECGELLSVRFHGEADGDLVDAFKATHKLIESDRERIFKFAADHKLPTSWAQRVYEAKWSAPVAAPPPAAAPKPPPREVPVAPARPLREVLLSSPPTRREVPAAPTPTRREVSVASPPTRREVPAAPKAVARAKVHAGAVTPPTPPTPPARVQRPAQAPPREPASPLPVARVATTAPAKAEPKSLPKLPSGEVAHFRVETESGEQLELCGNMFKAQSALNRLPTAKYIVRNIDDLRVETKVARATTVDAKSVLGCVLHRMRLGDTSKPQIARNSGIRVDLVHDALTEAGARDLIRRHGSSVTLPEFALTPAGYAAIGESEPREGEVRLAQ